MVKKEKLLFWNLVYKLIFKKVLEFIEKLRQKPEKTKNFIAFSASLFFAGCIFLMWLTVVFPDVRQDKATKDKIARNEPSPFSALFGNIAKGFSGVQEKFTDVKSIVSNFSANAVYYEATTTLERDNSNELIIIDETVHATSTNKSATSTIRVGE